MEVAVASSCFVVCGGKRPRRHRSRNESDLWVRCDDPQRGGSEATVRVAKADLVPTDRNLREQYEDWPALEKGCQQFMVDVNTRLHRATRQAADHAVGAGARASAPPPAAAARAVLRAGPQGRPAVDGQRRRRRVCGGARADRRACVGPGRGRADGSRARRRAARASRGRPPRADHAGKSEHQGTSTFRSAGRRAGAQARARGGEEREFLAIGEGAERWLKRAAAEGTLRVGRKMAEAVDLAKLHGAGPVGEALERCASYGRFADGELASILAD